VESLVNVGRPDSALQVAAKAVELMPGSPRVREIYAEMLTLTGAPAWRRLLALAQQDWLEGNLMAASARLDSVELQLPSMLSADACTDATAGVSLTGALRPELRAALESRVSTSEACNR
jgi:predicted Zn-dependent protease